MRVKPQKTVTFDEDAWKGNENVAVLSRQNEPAKWVASMLAYGLDCVWKWAGARDGLQHLEEYGAGFEGWYWRSSVVSSHLTTNGLRL